MSRLRSDTYIKPGSESSFDSCEYPAIPEDYHDVDEPYCCFTISKAASWSSVVSMFMLTFNFCLLLTGCNMGTLDMTLAVIPLVGGFTGICFLLVALHLNNPYPLVPYILYHTLSLGCVLIACTIYILFMLQCEFVYVLLEQIREASYVTRTLLGADSTGRTFIGLHLALNAVIHAVSLHCSIIYYLSLDAFCKTLSRECTEIL